MPVDPSVPFPLEPERRQAEQIAGLARKIRQMEISLQGGAVAQIPVVDTLPAAGRQGRMLMVRATSAVYADTGSSCVDRDGRPPPGAAGGGNYISNPSLADGVTGYTAGASNTLSLSAPGVGAFGPYAAKVLRTGTTGTCTLVSPRVGVPAAQLYCGSVSVRLGLLGRATQPAATPKINWYDAANTFLSSSSATALSLSIQGLWGRPTVTAALAPDTAAYAELQVDVAAIPVDEYYYFDGFQLEPSSVSSAFNMNVPASTITGSMLTPGTITLREAAIGSAKVYSGTLAAQASVTGMVAGALYVVNTSPGAIYWYDGTAWVIIAASQNVVNPIGFYDFPYTIDPRTQAASTMTMSANNIYYWRVQGAGEVNGIGYSVGTADSGNTLTFGIYSNSGTGRSAVPLTRKGTVTSANQSGTGYKTVTFGAPVTVAHGDWFALSTASTTLALMRASGASGNDIVLGLSLYQSGGGTAMPATVTQTLFTETRTAVLVGV